MALSKETIQADILAAFTQVMNDESEDREGALKKVAGSLAQAFINAMRSADIRYDSGLANGGGAVTGKFIGGLE